MTVGRPSFFMACQGSQTTEDDRLRHYGFSLGSTQFLTVHMALVLQVLLTKRSQGFGCGL
jgi:hypothetical protein